MRTFALDFPLSSFSPLPLRESFQGEIAFILDYTSSVPLAWEGIFRIVYAVDANIVVKISI